MKSWLTEAVLLGPAVCGKRAEGIDVVPREQERHESWIHLNILSCHVDWRMEPARLRSDDLGRSRVYGCRYRQSVYAILELLRVRSGVVEFAILLTSYTRSWREETSG